MLRILLLYIFICVVNSLLAQSPQKFNYQGIARDGQGNPMIRQQISLKLSVLPAADAVQADYEERQTLTTNEFGLYTLQIGAGHVVQGEFSKVNWETGNKYIRVAIDPNAGSNYMDAGTTQLLSVPYALYADKAGRAKTSGTDRTGAVSSNASHVSGDANFITKFTALNVIGKSRLFDNGTSVGLGTTSPVATASMHIRRTSSGQYLYMENPDSLGFGSFRMYNDVPTNFATFTKYGSRVSGGYTGIASLYPFANILGYGNNGPFLNAGTGNIGFAITKAGTNKLKIHIDAARERIGFGGNAVPQTPVHFNNTDAGNDTLKFTNQATGHTLNDGTELRFNGTATRLINRENAALIFGTNNVDRVAITASGNFGIGTTTPANSLQLSVAAVPNTGGIRLPITSASATQVGEAIGVNVSGDIVRIAPTDTTSLSSRINARLKYSDTSQMLANYVQSAGYGLIKSGQSLIADTASANSLVTQFALSNKLNAIDTLSLSNRIDERLKIADTSLMLANYVQSAGYGLIKSGQSLIADTASANSLVTQFALSNKLNAVDTLSLSNRIEERLRNSDTSLMLANYVQSAGYGLMKSGQSLIADTASANGLVTQFALSNKLNATDTLSLSNRIDERLKNTDTTSMLGNYVQSAGYGLIKSGQSLIADTSSANGLVTQFALSNKLNAADTLSLSTRIDERLKISDTSLMLANYVQSAGYGLMKSGQSLIADTASANSLVTQFALSNKLNATDTLSLSNRIEERLKNTDTSLMLANYVQSAGYGLVKSGQSLIADTSSANALVTQFALSNKLNAADTLSLSNRIEERLKNTDTSLMLANYVQSAGYGLVKSGQFLIGDTASANGLVTQFALSSKLNAVDTLSLSNRIEERLRNSDTSSMLANYIQSAGYGLVKSGQNLIADTASANGLVTQFALSNKLNAVDTLSLSTRIDERLKSSDTSLMLLNYVQSAGYGLLKAGQEIIADTSGLNGLVTQFALSQKLASTDTLSLSNRIDEKLFNSDTTSMLSNYVNQTAYGLSKTGQTISVDTSAPNGLATQYALSQKLSWSDTATFPGLTTRHELSQQWHLNGNDQISALHYLGTSNNMPLSLRANATELIKLSAPGPNSRQVSMAGSVVNEALILSNYSADGSLGTAAATVDQYECIIIPQTTSNIALTISNPTTVVAGSKLTIGNSGTAHFYLRGDGSSIGTEIAAHSMVQFVHNGTTWVPETLGGTEFFGTLRPVAGGTWSVLDDATHQSHNLTTVVTNPGGGNFNFSVDNNIPEEKVAVSIAAPDDTFAENGVYAGISQLSNSTRVQLSKQGFGVYIAYNGSAWTANVGTGTDLVTAADFSFSFDALTGVLTVSHSAINIIHEVFNISATPRDGVHVFLNAAAGASFQLVFRELATGALITNPTTACRAYVSRNGMWVPNASKLRNLGSGNVWIYGRYKN